MHEAEYMTLKVYVGCNQLGTTFHSYRLQSPFLKGVGLILYRHLNKLGEMPFLKTLAHQISLVI